jgi:hypothetical protein
MNTQDTNNILSLSSCSQRFSLLPIATNPSGQSLSSKGSLLKSAMLHNQDQTNHHLMGNDSVLGPSRPMTTNVAEVATYYSRWFQNMVKQ